MPAAPASIPFLNMPHPLLPESPQVLFPHLEFIPPCQRAGCSTSQSASRSPPLGEHPCPCHLRQALPLPSPQLGPCLFRLQHVSECLVRFYSYLLTVSCLPHSSVCSRRTGTLPVLLTILIPAPSTVPGSTHVASINQSTEHSMNWENGDWILEVGSSPLRVLLKEVTSSDSYFK